MKLIFVIDKLCKAGTQMHLITLASELERCGHKIKIVCLEEAGPEAIQLKGTGIELEALNIGPLLTREGLAGLLRLRRVIAVFSPDAVQCYLFKANIVGVLAAWLARVPLILSSRRSMGYDLRPRHILALRLLDPLTTATLVNSSAIFQHVIAKRQIPKSKLELFYNGVAVADHCHLPSDPKKLYPIVGMVANIRPIKDYENFIEAIACCAKKHPTLCGLIVGTGDPEYVGKIQALINTRCMSKNIQIIEDCVSPQVMMAQMDVAVLCSKSEGFSNVILEYMSQARPIIATKVGGNPEAIIHEQTGLLVEPENTQELIQGITRLLTDPELASRMGKQARQKVEQEFSLLKMGNRYERILSKLSKKELTFAPGKEMETK